MSEQPMQLRVVAATPVHLGPRFAVLERKRLPVWVVLLAAMLAVGALLGIGVGLRHSRAHRFREDAERSGRSPAGQNTPSADESKDDDPNQVDVIALGDAADAPVPARQFGHSGNVHPTILIRLPRFGPEQGLIPNSAVGHLLYGWLAAFNQTNPAAMARLLPSAAGELSAEAQMQLRQQTGGFMLLSAKEVAPGVLVFRLRDQTPDGTEVLGTLVMRADSEPAEVESLSMRSVVAND